MNFEDILRMKRERGRVNTVNTEGQSNNPKPAKPVSTVISNDRKCTSADMFTNAPKPTIKLEDEAIKVTKAVAHLSKAVAHLQSENNQIKEDLASLVDERNANNGESGHEQLVKENKRLRKQVRELTDKMHKLITARIDSPVNSQRQSF